MTPGDFMACAFGIGLVAAGLRYWWDQRHPLADPHSFAPLPGESMPDYTARMRRPGRAPLQQGEQG